MMMALVEVTVLRVWELILDIHIVMFVEGMLVASRLRLNFEEVIRIELKGAHILLMSKVVLLTVIALVRFMVRS